MILQAYTSDIVIKGKKAEKYQELKIKYDFDLIDIYMMSGIIGFLHNKKDIQENDSEATANLPRTTLNKRSDKIDILCQIIYLINEIDIDPDKAIKIAFETKKDDGDKLERRNLFFDYAMGGIDILYKILSNTDYDNQVNNLKNIIEKYTNETNIEEESLEDLLNKEGF